MKTFKVKNYKGNLVESLSRFQNSHKGMKIVEAVEDGDDLKIKAEESKEIEQKIEEAAGFSEEEKKLLESFFMGYLLFQGVSDLDDFEFMDIFMKKYLNRSFDKDLVKTIYNIEKETVKKNKSAFKLYVDDDDLLFK